MNGPAALPRIDVARDDEGIIYCNLADGTPVGETDAAAFYCYACGERLPTMSTANLDDVLDEHYCEPNR